MIMQHARMAVNSLRSNKIRTFLTLLGIIIGVMSVTTIIALGEGVKRQVNQQINDLGSDLITVVPGRDTAISGYDSLRGTLGSSASTARLSEADLEGVSKLENIEYAGGVMQLDGSIAREEKKVNTRILAVGEKYLELTKQKLSQGQFFGGSLENNNTVILAENVAQDLFGSSDPIGSTVTIRGNNFVIIGVLSPNKGFNVGQPISDMVLIPLPTGKTLNQDVVQLQQITVKLKDPAQAGATSVALKQELLKNHGGEEDFTITTQDQLVQTTDSVFKIVTGFTAAVASISLLVGGIGVMNIMLVTVTERTKEIGIRKAVGATRLQILMQFLIEALAITLTGGVLGILLSLVAGYVISSQTAIQPAMDLWIIALAAGVSLLVGIIFGTWPAIRAAHKDPIYALRHE
ncbi:MAG: putative transport system permease protein [Patescibacteria group bacterium]|jgi:putative ABC transport system permease protein|nr:putative transport system permease protein [Patescibacteria group bacterium]